MARTIWLLATLVSCAGARADDVPGPSADEECTVDRQCPGSGEERFVNPGNAALEAQLAARGLQRRCVRTNGATRLGSTSQTAVYCPPDVAATSTSSCMRCSAGASGSSRLPVAFALVTLGIVLRRRYDGSR